MSHITLFLCTFLITPLNEPSLATDSAQILEWCTAWGLSVSNCNSPTWALGLISEFSKRICMKHIFPLHRFFFFFVTALDHLSRADMWLLPLQRAKNKLSHSTLSACCFADSFSLMGTWTSALYGPPVESLQSALTACSDLRMKVCDWTAELRFCSHRWSTV